MPHQHARGVRRAHKESPLPATPRHFGIYRTSIRTHDVSRIPRIGSGINQLKSTVDEIRARFDNDVDRFSSLETGQTATIDAPISLELIAEAAWASTPRAQRVLDVGCGAGNFTLQLMKLQPVREVTLLDLSRPMLDRASERIQQASGIVPKAIQADIRETELNFLSVCHL